MVPNFFDTTDQLGEAGALAHMHEGAGCSGACMQAHVHVQRGRGACALMQRGCACGVCGRAVSSAQSTGRHRAVEQALRTSALHEMTTLPKGQAQYYLLQYDSEQSLPEIYRHQTLHYLTAKA